MSHVTTDGDTERNISLDIGLFNLIYTGRVRQTRESSRWISEHGAHYDSENPLALDELMAQADKSMNEEMNNGNDDLHEGNRQESGRN